MKKFLLLFVLLAACQTNVPVANQSVETDEPAELVEFALGEFTEPEWIEVSFADLPFSTEMPDSWELIELEDKYTMSGPFGGHLIFDREAMPVNLKTAFGPDVVGFDAGENVNAHCFEEYCYISSKNAELEDAIEYKIHLVDVNGVAREVLERLEFTE